MIRINQDRKKKNVKRESWGSQAGFLLATVGSAVGLGNVWRFPTVTALNGGGAFVLVYLVIILLLGLPVMIAELTLGRAGKSNVIGVFTRLAPRSKWWLAGVLPLAASFIILSFYAVIAGWTLLYIFSSLAGFTAGLDTAGLASLFAVLTETPVYPVAAQAVFLILTVAIVVVGVKKGIERWGLVLMPGIFLFLIILFIRTMFFKGVWSGIAWFLRPNLAALSFSTVLDAVGQVFFSFSLGMGAILTYGSYLPRDSDIPRNSFYISVVDLGVAILAGLIVIPSLFVFGLDPETGPGLIFITLPAVFNTIPLSMLWATLFFLLLAFAALTSAISMLEVIVAYLIEELRWTRFTAAAAAGAGVFLLGVPAALSRGVLRGVLIGGLDIFAFLDFIASNLMLPLGGLLLIIFVGWVWGVRKAAREIRTLGVGFRLEGAWSFLVRFVVPLAIGYILISGLRPKG